MMIANLKSLPLFCVLFLTSLAACRKRQSGVSLRVSVSDANTAKVWRKGSDDGRLWTLLIRTGEGIGGQINGNIARVADPISLALQAVSEQFQNLPADDAELAAELKRRLQNLVQQNPQLKALAQKWNLLNGTTNLALGLGLQMKNRGVLQALVASKQLLEWVLGLLKVPPPLEWVKKLTPVIDVLDEVLKNPEFTKGQLNLNDHYASALVLFTALAEGFKELVKRQAAENVFLLHWWLVDPKLAQYLVLWLSSALQANLVAAGGESLENVKQFRAMLEAAEKNGFSTKLGSGIAKIIGHTGKHGGPKIITAGLKRDLITDLLVSAEDSNHNDAKISWIKVTYIDKNGKRIEDNIGEQPVGASFSKEYQVPNLQTITVSARATQTGETKGLAQHIQELSDVGEFNHQTTLPELRDGIHRLLAYRKHWLDSMPGKRVGNARVRLKLELLQDGIVIGSKEIEAEKEVEATSVSYGG